MDRDLTLDVDSAFKSAVSVINLIQFYIIGSDVSCSMFQIIGIQELRFRTLNRRIIRLLFLILTLRKRIVRIIILSSI